MKALFLLATAFALTAGAASYEPLTTNGMNLARNASHDGRYVPITTWSSLSSQDTNLVADLYVFDRSAQSNILASVGPAGFTTSNSVHFGLISSNGNTVIFERGALYRRHLSESHEESMVISSGLPRLLNISRDARFTFYTFDPSGYYRRDNVAGTNQLISSISTAALSQDGQVAAYGVNSSRALVTNFLTGVTNNVAPAPAAMSADGRIIVARSTSLKLIVQDLATGSSNAFPIATTAVSLNANGSAIVCETLGYLGRLPYAQIITLDPATGTTNLISTSAGAADPGNGWSGAPVISRDGRFIAFESWASDLVPNDTNETKDVFLYDRLAATLKQINAGGGPAFNPFFSDDSATLFFHNGKTGGAVDIYAMPLDIQLLQITTLQFESNGTRRITWSSKPDIHYQLEYKNNIDDPTWTPLGPQLTSPGAQTSATDPDAQSTRFYRIRSL